MTREASSFERDAERPVPVSPVPALSVVMPVRNAMPYLKAAIESVLSQSFVDFELLVGDDCSTDGSAECAESYAARDSRIRVIRSTVWLGPVGSSDWIARQARAPLVARMDADDISSPNRFDCQVRAMAAHPEAVLVGSVFNMIDAQGDEIRGVDRFSLSDPRGSPPIAHTSILYRRSAFEQIGGYRAGTDYFEDADLYVRLLEIGDLLISAERLVSYRVAGNSARLNEDRQKVEESLNAMASALARRTAAQETSDRLAPEVFRTIGTIRLWSRKPLRVLLPMTKRMRLLPLGEAIRVFAWALFCSLSPPLARQVGRSKLAWRNARLDGRIRPDRLYRWRPHLPPVDVGGIAGEAGGVETGT